MKLVQNSEVKKRKNGFAKNSNKILVKLKKAGSLKKNKYHTGKIEGEDLPKSLQDKLNVPLSFLGIFLGSIVFLAITYLLNFLKSLLVAIGQSESGLLGVEFDPKFSLTHLRPLGDTKQYFMCAVVVVIGVAYLIYGKLNHESEKNLVYGQKGDSRLSTIKEIKRDYHEIPEKTEVYDGIGGVPISHYQDKYYIDRDTVNTVVLGASRSGKGETFVVPLLDNLSRAKIQRVLLQSFK